MSDYSKSFQVKGTSQPITYVKYGYKVSVNGASMPADYTFTANFTASEKVGVVVATLGPYSRNASIIGITYGLTGSAAGTATATGVISATTTQSFTVTGYNGSVSCASTTGPARSITTQALIDWLGAGGGNDYTLSTTASNVTIGAVGDHDIAITSDYNPGTITIKITPKSGAHFTEGSFQVTLPNIVLNPPTLVVA